MATDTTSAAPAVPLANGEAAPERTGEALARELLELEQRFPLPDRDELLADARWFAERWGRPAFEPYRGSCIAVLDGVVVAQGEDEDRLRLDLARARNLHPARFVIAYIPLRGEWTAHTDVSIDRQ